MKKQKNTLPQKIFTAAGGARREVLEDGVRKPESDVSRNRRGAVRILAGVVATTAVVGLGPKYLNEVDDRLDTQAEIQQTEQREMIEQMEQDKRNLEIQNMINEGLSEQEINDRLSSDNL